MILSTRIKYICKFIVVAACITASEARVSPSTADYFEKRYFVEKIGIIDLGSNNARLVIVEMLGDGIL